MTDDQVGFKTEAVRLKCPDCADGYLTIKTATRPRKRGEGLTTRRWYGCSNWPKCDGQHGCHQRAPYEPLGTPADKATRQARIKVHEVLDPLWQGMPRGMKSKTRSHLYARLSEALGRPYHTGESDIATCDQVINLLTEWYPDQVEANSQSPTNSRLTPQEEIEEEFKLFP